MMPKLRVRILKLASVVAVVSVAAILLKPNPDAKALGFVGSGKVIDSEFVAAGTSSRYWARISCDPEKVRQHLGIEQYTVNSTFPIMQNRFNAKRMNLPPNYGEYTTNWKEFEVESGRYVIVAFNDHGKSEILYLTWSD